MAPDQITLQIIAPKISECELWAFCCFLVPEVPAGTVSCSAAVHSVAPDSAVTRQRMENNFDWDLWGLQLKTRWTLAHHSPVVTEPLSFWHRSRSESGHEGEAETSVAQSPAQHRLSSAICCDLMSSMFLHVFLMHPFDHENLRHDFCSEPARKLLQLLQQCRLFINRGRGLIGNMGNAVFQGGTAAPHLGRGRTLRHGLKSPRGKTQESSKWLR